MDKLQFMTGITVTDQNFTSQVIDNKLPVVLDFWAPWCPPCKMIDPIMEELAKEYEGKIILGRVNADENSQVVEQLNVMSMPTVIYFKNGQPQKALVGAQGKQAYKQTLEEILAS